jgi:hypothetical protein
MVGCGAAVRFVVVLTVALCVCFGLSISAWGLPSGRVYEQVSPTFKGGYGAKDIDDVQVGGESLIYGSFGVFAGGSSTSPFHYYQADRVNGTGWASVSLNPPAALSPNPGTRGFSPSLEESLWDLPLHEKNAALADELFSEDQFYVRAGGEFRAVGPVLKEQDGEPIEIREEGVSDDFCHVLIRTTKALIPEAIGAKEQMYDVDTCGAVPAVRLVALTNSGGLLSPDCNPTLGEENSQMNAISADGSVVFFVARLPSVSDCEFIGKYDLFARVGGDRTLEVSKPIGEACTEVPCPGADARAPAIFRGASEDGSRVFFMTTAPLDPETDKDNTNDLYEATIGCPAPVIGCEAQQRVVTSLAQVSHDSSDPSEAAEVQGVVALSRDGSHVYFVARGVLSGEGPTVEGTQSLPVKGADNLYSYELDSRYPQGRVMFIGDLCSGPEQSGKETGDARCPSDLESEKTSTTTPRNDTVLVSNVPPAQTAGADGGILVFSTYARLITSGPEVDADNAQDVYRFDTVTGVMQRVSVGENGFNANGNSDDVEQIGIGLSGEFANMYNGDARVQAPIIKTTQDEERKLVRQAADENGSRIVFTTADPLSPAASNGQPNIYEWHDGSVSLISTGSSIEADELAVITPSGRDVFFVSSQGLVPQDMDGEPDVYDARIGGGFPQPPVPPAPCSGDACQGPLTNPAPLLVPGSVSQTAGENLSPPPKKSVKAKVKATRGKKAKRAGSARKGRRTR